PSRWQLADCLTKKGLSAVFRERMNKASTRLHELSLQHVKRNKDAKKKPSSTNYTWLCSFGTETIRKQTPLLDKQVAKPPLGCNFDMHISGGQHSSKQPLWKISGNFCHCGTPTLLVAQLTCLKGLKTKLVTQWKNFTEVIMPSRENWPVKQKQKAEAKAKAIQLPRKCKASSSTQPASEGVIRSTSPSVSLVEDPPLPPLRKKTKKNPPIDQSRRRNG
ncbi:MAG: hypothetical protein NLN65_05305, partial [Candidatus Poseidoniaceae archaeon]|nr:hypothetical protein [Candidatus Poseidoniaceae archaeon]